MVPDLVKRKLIRTCHWKKVKMYCAMLMFKKRMSLAPTDQSNPYIKTAVFTVKYSLNRLDRRYNCDHQIDDGEDMGETPSKHVQS
jgi:hypothetical protein